MSSATSGNGSLSISLLTDPLEIQPQSGTLSVQSDIFGVLAATTVTGNVQGTTGADDYLGQSGNDTISTYGGSDVVDGGAGDDRLYGGAGNDYLTGSSGSDYLLGDVGNDWLRDAAADATFDPIAAQVVRVYGATLGRAPDRAGHLGWTNAILNGQSLIEVISGFTGSQEFQNTYGSTTNTEFVTLLYQNVLSRAPDAAGLAGWLNQLDTSSMSREEVVRGFSESTEYQNGTLTRSSAFSLTSYAAEWGDEVYRLYRATLDRAPDADGFAGWANNLANGTAYLSVVGGFTGSQEFQNTYGSTTNSQFIELLYENVLNRASDADGLAGWLAQLDGATLTREQVVRGFAESQEHINSTAADYQAWLQSTGAGDVLEGGVGDDTLTGGVGGDRFVFSGDFGTDTITNFYPAGGDVIDFSQTTLSFDDLTITDLPGSVIQIQSSLGTILVEGGANGLTAATIDASMFSFGGGFGKASNSYANSGDDGKVETTGIVGDIQIQSNEANSLIGMDQFRADSTFSQYDGSGVAVVVIDTGIDLNHSAFGADANGDGVSDRIVYHQDFTSDGDGTADDVQGHGSNVASIVGSENSNYLGVAPGVDIIALQGLSNSGSGSISGLEAALDWVIQNAQQYNIVAVNMSLGPGDNTNTLVQNPHLGDEYAALYQQGIITNLAAGNDYYQYQTAGVSSLAADPSVLAVGAVWADDFGRLDWGSGAKDFTSDVDRVTSFSQRSDTLSNMIFAPGALIDGAAPGGGFGAQGGTSQATPVISGMVALAQQIAQDYLGRHLTPEEFRTLIRDTATTINDGDDEDDNVTNLNQDVPRANMLALAQAIQNMGGTTPPPTTTDDWGSDAGSAGALAIGGTATGDIEVGSDTDWFAVSLTAGTDYQFDLAGNTLSDPVLSLLDGAGNVLSSNDDFGGVRDSRISFTAQNSGTFYLSAQSYGEATGTYTLSGVSTGVTINDDYSGDTSTTGALQLGVANTGRLETAGDRDWFAVSLTAGTEYVLGVVANGADGVADTFLRFYDSAGNQLAFNDDFTLPDTGLTRDSYLYVTPETTGTYYVGAGAYGDTGVGDYAVFAVSNVVDGDVPDDQTTTASVTVGGSYEGDLDPAGDRDWIAVTLSGGTVYDISLAGFGTDDAVPDTYLRVYDASGNEIGFDDDSGEGFNSLLENFTVNASGTYFIEAAAFGDYYTGDYQVTVVEVGGGTSGDTAGDSGTTSTISPSAPVSDTLEFEGDRDWHQANVTAGQTYQINLTGDSLIDPYLRLYDGSSTLIGYDDDGAGNLDSEMIYTATQSGTIYISAGAFADSGTGSYSVTMTDLGGAVDDYSADNTTRGLLSADGDQSQGSVERSGDHDWFAVRVEAGAEYQFDVAGTGSSPLGDTTLAVRDAYGNLLGYDDDGGSGLNSSLSFFANYSGTLFLDVAGYSDAYTGDYLVSSTLISGGNDDYADDITTDGRVNPTGSTTGDIETEGDIDVFEVVLERGATYTFAANGNTLSDPTLTLLDEFGNWLDYNDDTNGLDSQITDYVATYSGSHYLSVAGYSDYYTGTYTVESLQTGSPITDDYGDTASTAGVLGSSGFAAGNLEDFGDRDWVALNVNAGDEFSFYLDGEPSGVGTLADPYLNLYDDAGNLIGYNDDANGTLESQLDFAFTRSGTYYLEARAFGDSFTGTWGLSAVQTAVGGTGDDYGDSLATAGQMTAPGIIAGDIETPGDWDLIAVNLAAGNTYDFNLMGNDSGQGTLSDPVLWLYDSAVNLVANDDDGGIGFDSQITYTAAETSTHYLLAQGYGDYYTGTWTMTADIL